MHMHIRIMQARLLEMHMQWQDRRMPPKPETPKLRGRRQPIPLTLPPALVTELDRLATAELRSRGMTIELLVREALAARSRRRARAERLAPPAGERDDV